MKHECKNDQIKPLGPASAGGRLANSVACYKGVLWSIINSCISQIRAGLSVRDALHNLLVGPHMYRL